MLSTPAKLEAPGPKFRRKIPDATSSPYFGLDRHLNQKAPSGRKRLLDDLNESGSPFVTAPALQHIEPAANTGAQMGKGLNRIASVDGMDLFGMSPLKIRAESCDSRGDIEIIDLEPTTSGPEREVVTEMADLRLKTRTSRVEKQIGSDPSTPNARSLSRIDRSENINLSNTKRSKKASGEATTPKSTSKGSPKYTSAETLRNTVGRMKV